MTTAIVTAERPEIQGLYKPLAFPDALRFDELFESATPYDGQSRTVTHRRSGRDRATVTSYCTGRGAKGEHFALNVQPRRKVLDFINAEMLVVANDSIHFQVVDHDGGFSLVIVSYGQMIGSRWLAYVETASIPREERP